MSVAIFRPTTIGTYDQMSLLSGATKPIAVDPLWPIAHDDVATRLGTAADGQYQSFTGAAVAVSAGAKINSVTVYERSYGAGDPASVGVFLRLGGVDSSVSWRSQSIGSWSTSSGAVIARPGGGSWVYADLATLQIGVVNSAGTLVTTSLWAMIDYTLSGGFPFIFMPALRRRRK
jgi:hypothetical protein